MELSPALQIDVGREGTSKTGQEAAKMLKQLSKGDKVCLLERALYGLRQAGISWYRRIDGELKNYSAKPTTGDLCLYYVGEGENLSLISIYIDDIIVASKNRNQVTKLGQHLSRVFDVKDVGPVNYCLGMEFKRKDGKIAIQQIKYILAGFGMRVQIS